MVRSRRSPIAVLPFIDMSEKKDQEYFSDGLSEELIDLLAQVQDLRVPARTSSFAFKGKADDCRRTLLRNCASPTCSKGACGKLATRSG